MKFVKDLLSAFSRRNSKPSYKKTVRDTRAGPKGEPIRAVWKSLAPSLVIPSWQGFSSTLKMEAVAPQKR
jgi:hypothetical protein